MRKRIATFALMASLASALALGDDKTKSTSSAENGPPAAAATDRPASSNNCPCADAKDNKDDKKDKNKAKPAPADQEEQFNKMLMGIYG
jgi:hypothetical protein